ncbi:F-box associated interaction domain [Arabidopsis thaliana x Arabidopsis arenosa]|uniref:F-box associated interaction domain n=1 Tax=Arabidopsis thaliana x Arabidopsis arenosa TaxID=1240361 RepID=A0A8T1ZLJ3_9BRAS|nr:F-box associated interaction domain [Arabidopsis thaliana x Arabidopsis arenosa]
MECRILGSCSGLLLLSVNNVLCVANPLTKKFRFLNQPRSRFLPNSLPVGLGHETKYIGFALYEIDQTTQGFKTVCITEVEKRNPDDDTTYRFEINAGDSWRFSKTKITCSTSDLDISMRKPVYLDGSLHWIRNDGSIVAFNPETEQARLISTEFPQELRALFAAGNNSLTLISAFKDVIYVYALENILTNPKWVLVRQIRNVVLDQTSVIRWNVEAYDGKCLVLRVETNNGSYNVRNDSWIRLES